MRGFLYGLYIQWKLDIRSKSMLITCYLIPLAFFLFMGGIFTSITPDSKHTLIQSMSVFGVSMGGLIGLPPSLMEIYSSDIKKVYKANGVPLYSGVAIHFISALIHLFIMCLIIFFTAPILFHASIPHDLPRFFISLAIFIAATLSIGCIFGLVMKNMSKLTMVSQIVFMPSIMLSGIMFPAKMLPKALSTAGKAFPATWGYLSMTEKEFTILQYLPMVVILVVAVSICILILAKKTSES